MSPIRLAVPCCALMTTVLLSACTDSSTESDDVVSVAEETSSATTAPSTSTSAPEPTYTYTAAPGEVFLLPKDSDFGTMGAGRYEAWRIGSPVHYEVDVPEGWRVLAGTYLNAPTDGHGSSSSPRCRRTGPISPSTPAATTPCSESARPCATLSARCGSSPCGR